MTYYVAHFACHLSFDVVAYPVEGCYANLEDCNNFARSLI